MRRSIRQVQVRWRQAQVLVAQQSGQTMAEYATVLAVVVIGVAVALTAFASAVNGMLQREITTIFTAF